MKLRYPLIAFMFWLTGVYSWPGLDNWIEGSKVYGIPLTEKPWDHDACVRLGNYIARLEVLKKLGARKSLVMAEYDRRLDNKESIRELSEAWDKEPDPAEYVNNCIEKANMAARGDIRT